MPNPNRPRICQTCHNITQGACTRCRAAYERQRGTPTARGYGYQWSKMSRYIIERDHGICWLCGKPDADTADHILRLRDGGTNDPANLRAAHRACNSRRG